MENKINTLCLVEFEGKVVMLLPYLLFLSIGKTFAQAGPAYNFSISFYAILYRIVATLFLNQVYQLI